MDYFLDLPSTDSKDGPPVPSWILAPFFPLGFYPPEKIVKLNGLVSVPSPHAVVPWIYHIPQVSPVQHAQFELFLSLPAPRCVPLAVSYLGGGSIIFLVAPARHLKVIPDSFLPHILSVWSHLYILFLPKISSVHLNCQCPS